MGCGGSKGAAFAPSAAPVDLSPPRQPPHGRETPPQPAPGAAEPAQQPPGAAGPGPAPGPASQEGHPSWRKSVEEARLRTLYELGALDQARKRQLDNLASLVRGVLGVEGAFVLLIEAEQVVAAGSAVGQGWPTSVPRGGSVSKFMLRSDAPALLVVEDASLDPRFKDAALVSGPPYARFIALAALVASDSGHRYGVLAVVDTRPRPGGLAPEQTTMLQKFAGVAVQELEREKVEKQVTLDELLPQPDKSLQRQQQELAAARQQRHVVRALDGLQEPMCVLDTGQPHWPIAYANKAWEEATGVDRRQAALRAAGFWGLFALASVRPQQQLLQQQQQHGPFVGGSSFVRSVRFPEANLPLQGLTSGSGGASAGAGSASGTSGSMGSSAGSAAAIIGVSACPLGRFGAVPLSARSHQGSDSGPTSGGSAAATVHPSGRIGVASAAAAAAASGCSSGSSGGSGAARAPWESAGAPDSCAGPGGEQLAQGLHGRGASGSSGAVRLSNEAAAAFAGAGPAASGPAGTGASEAERSARGAVIAGRAFDAVVQRSAAAGGGGAAGADAAAQGSAGAAAEQRAAAAGHLLFRFRPITGGDYFGSGLLSLNSGSSADSTLGAAAAAATKAVQRGSGGSGGAPGLQQQAGGSGPGQQALPLGAPTAVPAADRGKGSSGESSGGALPLAPAEAGLRYVATVRPFDPDTEPLEGLSEPVSFEQQPQDPGHGSGGAAAAAGATAAAVSPTSSDRSSLGRQPGSRLFDYSSFKLPQPSSILDSALVASATTSNAEDLKEVQGITFGPLIGQGAFGRCYRGTWQGASVAIKVMECSPSRQHGLGGQHAIVEALLSRSLSHPHVCPTYDWRVVLAQEDEPGAVPRKQILLIQRYCNRGSLIQTVEQGRLKRRDGQPDLPKILLTGIDVAGAIEYLHSQGIIHGDLSGNNVLLTSSSKDFRRWIAQVADFGLSRALAGGVVQTSSLRTVTHMPPELLLDGVLTPAADIYSLGVLLCEMWTGERAWKGTGAVQVINAVTSPTGPGLQPPAAMPPELQELTRACLARSAQDRPSLKDVLSRLNRLLRNVKRQEGSAGQQPAAA